MATFDSSIHFYALRPGQSTAQMLVVPDVADPFCPAPASVVVPLRQSRELVRGCQGCCWGLLLAMLQLLLAPAQAAA